MTRRGWLRPVPPLPMGGCAVKTVIIIIILLFAVLTAIFVICLATCAGTDDELTRMLDDAEQAEYVRKWSEGHKRRKRK